MYSESYELDPEDAAWWSLRVRRAELGAQALRALLALRVAARGSALVFSEMTISSSGHKEALH